MSEKPTLMELHASLHGIEGVMQMLCTEWAAQPIENRLEMLRAAVVNLMADRRRDMLDEIVRKEQEDGAHISH